MGQVHLKSMTAFGRGVALFPYGRFTVEIQSVNRRYLEINVSLPRAFARFEIEIRKQIAARVGRGAVNLSLFWKADDAQPISVAPNLALARAIQKGWNQLTQELGLQDPLPLSLLVQEKNLLDYEEEIVDEKIYQQAINGALKEALDALITMKEAEGEVLARDIQQRLEGMDADIENIEAKSQDAPEKYRQKLSSRLQELFSGSPEHEERILREVAVYSEKIDITEEIVRFKSHLSQFKKLITSTLENEIETRGKTLDFLLQELAREINTIGSKTSDLVVAQHVIRIKGELEKIREQIQNIE